MTDDEFKTITIGALLDIKAQLNRIEGPLNMTNEELTELIKMHRERLDLLTRTLNDVREALHMMREMIELHGQRLDNMENKLFGLYPPKEP